MQWDPTDSAPFFAALRSAAGERCIEVSFDEDDTCTTTQCIASGAAVVWTANTVVEFATEGTAGMLIASLCVVEINGATVLSGITRVYEPNCGYACITDDAVGSIRNGATPWSHMAEALVSPVLQYIWSREPAVDYVPN